MINFKPFQSLYQNINTSPNYSLSIGQKIYQCFDIISEYLRQLADAANISRSLTWTNVALAIGWTNFDPFVNYPVQIAGPDSEGIVRFRGTAVNSSFSSGGTALTVPKSCYPTRNAAPMILALVNGTYYPVELSILSSNGTASPTGNFPSPGNIVLFFDGINYSVSP